MRVPRRRGLVIPVITIGQSTDWMEITECSPHVLRSPHDSPEIQELREKLGDLLFLSARLLREKEALGRQVESLKLAAAVARRPWWRR